MEASQTTDASAEKETFTVLREASANALSTGNSRCKMQI
jgi:hypothetical protein